MCFQNNKPRALSFWRWLSKPFVVWFMQRWKPRKCVYGKTIVFRH